MSLPTNIVKLLKEEEKNGSFHHKYHKHNTPNTNSEQQLKTQIQHLKQQQKLLLNHTHELIAYYDTNLQIIWTNKAAAQSVNKTPEEMIGKHCYELWNSNNTPCPDCPLLKSLKTKKPEEVEKQTPDGRYWHISGYPVFNQHKKIEYLLEIGQDITHQKNIQNTYENKEIQYLDLIENASDLIQEINPDGTINYVNKAWKLTLGYREKDIKKLSIFDIISPEYKKHYQQSMEQLLQGKSISHFETEFLTKDKKRIMVEGNLNCRIENGKPISTRGIFRDISLRKLNEQKFEEKISQLELFQKITVDRELKMIALKKEINEILEKNGKPPKYQLPKEQTNEGI